MSNETKAAKPAKTDGAAETSKPGAMRVRVLKNGFDCAAGTCAAGAVINLTTADAELFEKRGDVKIIGAA